MTPAPLVETRGLTRHFALRRGLVDRVARRPVRVVRALDGVDLAIARGETFGLIGESGCGKTTLGRTVIRLQPPTAGSVRFDGVDVTALGEAALKPLRRRMQIVFQDPYASLNPRFTVEEIVGLPLRLHEGASAATARPRVAAMLERVGLRAAHARRYPHQFSGGQRQRIGIARALILRPDFVVCDEPVSALDVSIQAQILALLEELRAEFGLTYLFISHNLAVVAYLSDRIGVMHLGELVETAPRDDLVRRPLHPYTHALLSAVPRIAPGERGARIRLAGDLPSPLAPPAGCRFHTRCPLAMQACRTIRPVLTDLGGGRSIACHLHVPPAGATPSASANP